MEAAKNDAMTLAYEREAEIKLLREIHATDEAAVCLSNQTAVKALTRAEAAEAEIKRLREALKIARLHAPSIRLAPERRHTIAVLEAALAQSPEPK
jgi:predicted translin family RNA/ssDNA-binding protein